jgi:hypothetical protein
MCSERTLRRRLRSIIAPIFEPKYFRSKSGRIEIGQMVDGHEIQVAAWGENSASLSIVADPDTIARLVQAYAHPA